MRILSETTLSGRSVSRASGWCQRPESGTLAKTHRQERAWAEPARWFVLNTEANVEVDFTALEAVDAVRAELAGRGTVFALARVKQDLLDDLAAFGLVEKIGEQRIFPTLPTAVAAYRQWADGHPPPGPDHPA
jgi:MFS superfamily sulfate permease-like transporter